jgi:hypothetical protein
MALKINDNGTTRNMTADEEAAHIAWAKQAEAEAKAQIEAGEARANARKAVLSKLGLSDEEAAVLLG